MNKFATEQTKRLNYEATKQTEHDKVEVPAWPQASKVRIWKTMVLKGVSNASTHPSRAFKWARQAILATDMFQLQDSGEFERLDHKLQIALFATTHGEFQRKIMILEETLEKQDLQLKGRQLFFLIYQHLMTDNVDGALLEFQDLLNVQLRSNNLAMFLNDWDMTLSELAVRPDDAILENLFYHQVEKCNHFSTCLDQIQGRSRLLWCGKILRGLMAICA